MEPIKQNSRFKLLGQIVSIWRKFIQGGGERAKEVSEKIWQIDNPYKPDCVLEPELNDDGLFVGRGDLVLSLKESLDRGNYRPVLFLCGERRMGKSSLLKYLPVKLGSHYLPVIYDLQRRDVSFSTFALLSTIAEEVYKEAELSGIVVKRLSDTFLKDASERNDATIYYVLDGWLKNLERVLEYEHSILLLIFDGYERLDDAGQEGYLNLRLLLDWFRSISQNHPQLALLFSGVQTLGEMKMNWSGYFINAQILKISFLQEREARDLILTPIPNYPGEQVFNEEVVEEIVRVTGCHPFLLQALCSTLINNLNTLGQGSIEVHDVSMAVSQLIHHWSPYFRDLWERTDQNQRRCLRAIRSLEKSSLQEIIQRCGIDEKVARDALQTLLRRDLIIFDKQNYQVSIPILGEWIKYND